MKHQREISIQFGCHRSIDDTSSVKLLLRLFESVTSWSLSYSGPNRQSLLSGSLGHP